MVSRIRLHIFHDLHRKQSNRRLSARARQMSARLKGVAQVCVCVCCHVGRVCPKTEDYADESEQQLSASAPPASLSLLGNFEVEQTSRAFSSTGARWWSSGTNVAAVGAHPCSLTATLEIFAVLFKTKSNLATNADFKCVVELSTVGMCAELPPGAFRGGGGFHCRGGGQRLLLSQSPDPTCRRVLLQRLRRQRTITIYGESLNPDCLTNPVCVIRTS